MQQMIFIADLIACSTCFGAPLCPSSGAREYYTSGCVLSYLVLWLYNTLELLMMGTVVPETC